MFKFLKKHGNIASLEMARTFNNGIGMVLIVSANQELQKIFAANEAQILKLARAGELNLGEGSEIPKASARAVLTGGAELAVPLAGLIDFARETERL